MNNLKPPVSASIYDLITSVPRDFQRNECSKKYRELFGIAEGDRTLETALIDYENSGLQTFILHIQKMDELKILIFSSDYNKFSFAGLTDALKLYANPSGSLRLPPAALVEKLSGDVWAACNWHMTFVGLNMWEFSEPASPQPATPSDKDNKWSKLTRYSNMVHSNVGYLFNIFPTSAIIVADVIIDEGGTVSWLDKLFLVEDECR